MNEKNQIATFTEHALKTKSEFLKHLVMKEQKRLNRQLTAPETLRLLNKRLVCPHCERFSLRSRGYDKDHPIGTCRYCGTSGTMMSVREYIDGGYFK